MKRSPAHNSTYKKLAVQWLNEALWEVQLDDNGKYMRRATQGA